MRNATQTARPARRSAAASGSLAGPSPVTDDRRTRLRLRDLCDEVLASYRAASERELFSARDREEARRMVEGFALAGRG